MYGGVVALFHEFLSLVSRRTCQHIIRKLWLKNLLLETKSVKLFFYSQTRKVCSFNRKKRISKPLFNTAESMQWQRPRSDEPQIYCHIVIISFTKLCAYRYPFRPCHCIVSLFSSFCCSPPTSLNLWQPYACIFDTICLTPPSSSSSVCINISHSPPHHALLIPFSPRNPDKGCDCKSFRGDYQSISLISRL